MNKINVLLILVLTLSFSVYAQSDEKVYDATKLENTPVFAKGKMTLEDFLRFYQQYPEEAKNRNVYGTVMLSLIISADGDVVNSGVSRSIDASLDNEALRLANLMPQFTPALKDGKAVASKVQLAIPFTSESQSAASGRTATAQTALEVQTASGQKFPLYVIDGKIIDEDINVNADNIESVRVMKGQKAIERYGQRASDGVIIFKTKNTTQR